MKVNDIHSAVQAVERAEEIEEGKSTTVVPDTLDDTGMPTVPLVYRKYSCEQCGTFFHEQFELSTTGQYPLVKYCTPECRAGAAKSRRSEEQRQINEYLKNNPRVNW